VQSPDLLWRLALAACATAIGTELTGRHCSVWCWYRGRTHCVPHAVDIRQLSFAAIASAPLHAVCTRRYFTRYELWELGTPGSTAAPIQEQGIAALKSNLGPVVELTTGLFRRCHCREPEHPVQFTPSAHIHFACLIERVVSVMYRTNSPQC
jgi:hypothetical protein